VTIYAHLDPSDVAVLDATQNPVLVEQIRQWCTTAGTKVTIRPVIDLAANPTTTAYTPTDSIREHVTLRDRTCVFPHCNRRKVDLDHIHPYDAGGTTSADNLAMLCRRHHRAKTHSGWRYAMTEPGLYAWTSPTGANFDVDRRPPHRRRP
jgi:5-methylcytosine-specific restriction endonuclease McrA